MNQDDFRKLVSGQNAGLGAVLLRLLLGIAAVGYSLAIRLRNLFYRAGLLKIRQVDVIVISVGNITVGGTGKTPLVIWMCKFLLQKELRCAVLTRGYKTSAHKQETNIDEPGILAESCPQAKVIVNPDRVAGANEAVNKFGAKVLIMDDGFQHRRLARDIDIVTIDATLPFGYGRMFPAGLLREPVDSLKRADAIIITRSNQVSESELNKIEEKLQEIKPDIVIARSIHSPVCVKYPKPEEAEIQKKNKTMDSCSFDYFDSAQYKSAQDRLSRNDSIEELKGKKIFAFCGIGNPDAFIKTIKGLGANLVGAKIYDDHYHYNEKDIEDIRTKAKELKAELVLTTQKDWSKIIGNFRIEICDFQSSIPFVYLKIELKLVSGEDAITRLIKGALAGIILKK